MPTVGSDKLASNVWVASLEAKDEGSTAKSPLWFLQLFGCYYVTEASWQGASPADIALRDCARRVTRSHSLSFFVSAYPMK